MHTPGPWRLEIPPMPYGTKIPDIIGANDWCVAEHVERMEDARLIAAAPKLLAALKTFVEYEEPGAMFAEHVQQAIAAINEAEGRTE